MLKTHLTNIEKLGDLESPCPMVGLFWRRRSGGKKWKGQADLALPREDRPGPCSKTHLARTLAENTSYVGDSEVASGRRKSRGLERKGSA